MDRQLGTPRRAGCGGSCTTCVRKRGWTHLLAVSSSTGLTRRCGSPYSGAQRRGSTPRGSVRGAIDHQKKGRLEYERRPNDRAASSRGVGHARLNHRQRGEPTVDLTLPELEPGVCSPRNRRKQQRDALASGATDRIGRGVTGVTHAQRHRGPSRGCRPPKRSCDRASM